MSKGNKKPCKPKPKDYIACAHPDYIARQRAHNLALSALMHKLASEHISAGGDAYVSHMPGILLSQ